MAGHHKWGSFRHRRGAQRGRQDSPLRRERPPAAPGAGPYRIRCEAYGPGGSALLVDCLTGDRAGTAARVRQTLLKFGGSPGAEGSVSYLFNQVGLMVFPPGTPEEQLNQVALEAGAEDVVPNADGSLEVLADPLEFETVQALIVARGMVPDSAEVTQRAATSVKLDGAAAVSMVKLLEALESLEDVQNVYTNAEIPDEVMAHV